MMKSFIKSLFLVIVFCAALGALFMPNPLRVDDRLVYVAGKMDQMVAPDTYIINGEKVKIWGVTSNLVPSELDQIEAVAAQMSAQNGDAGAKAAAREQAMAEAEDTMKMRVASLRNVGLHCIRKGDAKDDGAVVMACYTQNMKDFATCLLGRGVVKPESGLQNAAYSNIHKAAAAGKAGKWERCH